MTKHSTQVGNCPCGSKKPFSECCQPYVSQNEHPTTAEALMRSRYTAFSLQIEDYLHYSWHPNFCPRTIHLNAEIKWLGLKIVGTQAGNIDDETGEVEFIARSKSHGKANRLHENSQFVRFENRWVYTNGKISHK